MLRHFQFGGYSRDAYTGHEGMYRSPVTKGTLRLMELDNRYIIMADHESVLKCGNQQRQCQQINPHGHVNHDQIVLSRRISIMLRRPWSKCYGSPAKTTVSQHKNCAYATGAFRSGSFSGSAQCLPDAWGGDQTRD